MGVSVLPSILPISLLFLSILLIYAQEDFPSPKKCPSNFRCGTTSLVQFPLYDNDTYPGCGLLNIGCNGTSPKIYLGLNNSIEFIVHRFLTNQSANVSSLKLLDFVNSKSCEIFYPLYDPPIYISYTISPSLTLFSCDTSNITENKSTQKFFRGNYFSYGNCQGSIIYYPYPNYTFPNSKNIPPSCQRIHLPVIEGKPVSKDLFSLLGNNFTLGWKVSSDCMTCHLNGGRCSHKALEFRCKKDIKGKKNMKVILATVIPGCVLLTIIMSVPAFCYRKKWKDASTYISSRNISSDPSSKSDLEGNGFFLGISVFSYAELEEATDDFAPSRELGDGGFGTVYHGKLRDGREVAVKRLYEHNYKRVTQFRNEIEILTRIHHKNLVTLYGCTSRQSRELLLVYEYIPNGTVADHLHGDWAKDGPLTWPIRINIAIETASALAYLHKSGIIHRDVKTNNILLDNNFYVKVADFGLSRSFPKYATHVSTAPQGTPGYVDPEYHQCYQLTEKSDVYSFGVVLIELLSSMPAVDVNRHRYEINLANLAMNKIQNRALEELIDPSLGFDSDPSVERMITSVAEVAFRCLQLEKEMRPSMGEVLDALIEIRDYKNDKSTQEMDKKLPPHSPEVDHVMLLKTNKIPPSPFSVIDKWASASTSMSSG